MLSHPRTPGSTRGSRRVDVLHKKELHDRVHLVHKDIDAHYMWIEIKRGDLRELYMQFATFHWHTQGLHLSVNHHIYDYMK